MGMEFDSPTFHQNQRSSHCDGYFHYKEQDVGSNPTLTTNGEVAQRQSGKNTVAPNLFSGLMLL